MLRLFVSSDSFFSSVSWQRYAYALVTFRQRKHLVRVRKRPGFGLKYLALSPQTQQQIFCHLVKNCAFFCCQKHDWNEFFPERYLFVLPSCTSATVPSASLVLTKLLKFVRFYSLPKAGRGKVTRILLKLLRLLEQQRLGLLRCLWWVDGLQVCERQALQPIRKATLWENTTESIIMTTSFCSGNLAAFWREGSAGIVSLSVTRHSTVLQRCCLQLFTIIVDSHTSVYFCQGSLCLWSYRFTYRWLTIYLKWIF